MLKILEYIKNNPNWEEDLTLEPYFLRIRRKDNFIMLSYTRESIDFSIHLVRESMDIIQNSYNKLVSRMNDYLDAAKEMNIKDRKEFAKFAVKTPYDDFLFKWYDGKCNSAEEFLDYQTIYAIKRILKKHKEM